MNRRSILAAYKKKSSHLQTGVTGFKSGNLFKKDTFIHSRNKMSSFESLTGNHTNWQRQGCQIIYRFPPSTITELL